MFYTYLLWYSGIVLLGIILFRGYRNGTQREYLAFYIYVGYVLVSSLLSLLISAVWGKDSRAYFYAWHFSKLPMPLMQLWILWDCIRLIFGKSKTSWKEIRGAVIVAVMLSLPVGWEVLSLVGGNLFYRYHAFALSLQGIVFLLVFGTVFAQKKVVIGRNMKAILSGLGLLVAMQGLNFSQFLFQDLPFEVFGFAMQFIYFTALMVFTWGLWEPDPVRLLNRSERLQLVRIDENLRRVIRSLLLPR
jgi:hypothetical protein